MRLFVGVTPKNLKENARLKQVHSKIKRTVSGWEDPVRWTPPPMWHVTLLFLGQKTPEEYERTEKLLDRWVPPEGIELSFQGLGAFPSAQEGRILWVGVRENKALLRLQSSLEEEFIAQNLISESDRDYRPHLTLARFRHTRHLQSLISLGAKTDFGTEPVDELILFESVTEGHISKYIPRFVKRI